MRIQMHAQSWMHKCMYINAHTKEISPLFCSWLEKMNEGELKREDSAKLEEIFHLLRDCSKASTTPRNSSPLHSPIPIQVADRSVTQSVPINVLPNNLAL